MADFTPIDLSIIDNNGNTLFSASVPFNAGMTARNVLEQAFIGAQTAATPDPVDYTLEFFGYSENPQYPGFLGYEIDSLAGLPGNAQFYWELLIGGVMSQTGADTTFPAPGASVTWQYVAIGPALQAASPRAELLHGRREARRASRAS